MTDTVDIYESNAGHIFAVCGNVVYDAIETSSLTIWEIVEYILEGDDDLSVSDLTPEEVWDRERPWCTLIAERDAETITIHHDVLGAAGKRFLGARAR
jgi:hypothetical protein